MIVIMAGLPGSGKSWLAKNIYKKIDAYILDRDRIRNLIFPSEEVDYSPEQNELASQVSYQVAEFILSRHPERCIILDGRPFSKKKQIDIIRDMAIRLGHILKIIYCVAPDDIVRERLVSDKMDPRKALAGRNMDKYFRIKESFEPIIYPHLIVDTSRPRNEIIELAIAFLKN